MPGMVRKQISSFEALARRVVEGSIGRLIGDDDLTVEIAARLSKALEEGELGGDSPRAYHVIVNPADLRSVETQIVELEQHLTRYASMLRRNGPQAKVNRPVVRLIPDETMPRGNVDVDVSYGRSVGDTTSVLNQEVRNGLDKLRLLDAFLIVNGRRHVALDKPLVTIGRRVDNDVIIDLPVVSRQHAHVRWRHGRFVVYDVGSRGGVQLNGERITESVLAPGDLVTLSERVPLIYGEGLESRKTFPRNRNGSQDTQAYSSEDN